MKPVRVAQPALPDGPVRGAVTLMVIVDPAGRVVKAEPVYGPEALRRAATDAAMKWEFHPVIRDGAPVFAYTDWSIYFQEPGQPYSDAADNDREAVMKFLIQRRLLEDRFPRTPEEILADTELNLDDDPVWRALLAPGLAEAAWDARALDKAVAYASEAVHNAARNPRAFGEGFYAAEEVLGLVALQRDDVAKAREYLMESPRYGGSAFLMSFGPDLELARELLKKGETDTVLKFLEACRPVSKTGGPRIDALEEKIRAGGVI